VAPFLIRQSDLVHIHLAAQHSMLRKLPIILATKLMRRPYVVHLHAASENSVFRLTPQWLVRLIFLLSYRVIVLSDSWAAVVRKYIPDTRVTVLHNPVAKPRTPRLRPAEETQVVLFAGKLERRKGYLELLEAASEVLMEFPRVHFCFAGHGEIEQARALAQSLGIERSVSFAGWVGPAEMHDHFRAATIFCLPSFDEGLPMAVLEAMSHSIPVVCTPVGGLPDLISDGTNGLFAEAGNVASIADHILALLRSPDWAMRIGHSASLTIERECSIERIEQELAELYQDVNAEWILRRRGIREGAQPNLQVRPRA